MIPVTLFAGKPVFVLGLGLAGLAAVRALKDGGSEVAAWDDKESVREKAAAQGLSLVDPAGFDWNGAAAMVLSPGIPHSHPRPHPAVSMARSAGCPVVGEVELLYRSQIAATFVGITGTNGKSTTTALIGHVLQKAGRKVQVGANLGVPALALDPLGDDGIYVLEMSSYQLELLERTIFDVALLLNVTPDHLERHGGMEGYVAAKTRIFEHQDESCTAIVGMDDAYCRRIAAELEGPELIPVSAEGAVEGGVWADDGMLIDAGRKVMDLRSVPSLPGRHNWQNAAAAYAAVRAIGLSTEEAVAGIKSYPGLAHRQQLVGERGGVRFVNDSKATNADAAVKALSSYDAIYWIAGGRPKETGLQGVEPWLERVRTAFLIGEAEDDFAAFLKGRTRVERCGTLDQAVAAAYAAASEEGRDGAVVLLSPACASFDQFANFEERGEAFARLVEALP